MKIDAETSKKLREGFLQSPSLRYSTSLNQRLKELKSRLPPAEMAWPNLAVNLDQYRDVSRPLQMQVAFKCGCS